MMKWKSILLSLCLVLVTSVAMAVGLPLSTGTAYQKRINVTIPEGSPQRR